MDRQIFNAYTRKKYIEWLGIDQIGVDLSGMVKDINKGLIFK